MSDLQQYLASDTYMRERIDPQPEDPFFLHLVDLLALVQRHATNEKIRILDYGAGGSPYRSLFPNAEYSRADYIEDPEDAERFDYVIEGDCSVNAPSESFDFVISTQVAEHVTDFENYLAEVRRVLVPGGSFLCTTHGIWEQHGAPYDFRRWTSIGLEADVRAGGFDIEKNYKLTTGPRALLSILLSHWQNLSLGSKRPIGILIAVARRILGLLRPPINRQAHRSLQPHAIIENDARPENLYIGVAVLGRKPIEGASD